MKTHKFDTISFIAGLLITVAGLVFLLPADTGTLIDTVTDLGSWLWAVLFLVVGLAILVPTVAAAVSRSDEEDDQTV